MPGLRNICSSAGFNLNFKQRRRGVPVNAGFLRRSAAARNTMESFIGIFNNYALACAALGWLIAQILKFFISLIIHRKVSLYLLISSGGMPSSHSATVCSLAVAVGRLCGFESTTFAVAFILAFIVMYDAAGVRRAAGEQAKMINNLVRETQEYGADMDMYHELKELLGHTPVEVAGGAVLGIIIPFLVPVF